MKLKCLIAVAAIVLAANKLKAEANPWARKLPFEQAVITYTLSGMEAGTEILYIREYGLKTARYRTTRTTMLGLTQKRSSVEITTPDWLYIFDLQEGTGSKSINPRKLMIEEYEKLSDAEKEKVNENSENMAGVVSAGLHGDLEPNVENILGYSCDRVRAIGSTIYMIHGTGIHLSYESDLLGIKMKSVATSIKMQGAEQKYFEFPKGIDPQPDPEADRTARIMAQQAIVALKDPERFRGTGQGLLGLPEEQPDIPEEDKMQMEEAMETIKGLFGN